MYSLWENVCQNRCLSQNSQDVEFGFAALEVIVPGLWGWGGAHGCEPGSHTPVKAFLLDIRNFEIWNKVEQH